jgi:hypothetical protein
MSSEPKKNVKLMLVCGMLLAVAHEAGASGMSPIVGALGEWKPIVDIRARYENVEQVGFARDADAGTIRARLGIETGKAWNTSLLAEGEFVEPFLSNYNSTVNGKSQYPTVADPRTEEVNRLQLTNASIPQTTLTLGRQRIILDDQRFVGNVGWRQNEQTFDALRVVNKGIANLTIDAGYFNQANRVFSKESVQGRYRGDNFLANVAYQTPFGKLTGFSYLLKFDPLNSPVVATRNQSRNDSSATYGARFAGDRPVGPIRLSYAASYAYQTDYGDNLLKFQNDYYLGEINAAFRQFSAGIGLEILDGTGVKGFTTPLATLHKFQGWADKFLTTPANGINDEYASVTWTTKGLGPFDTMSATAIYHDFESKRLAADQGGSEVDLQLLAKWQRVTTILKYADYKTKSLMTDTKKLWVEFTFVW